MPDKTPGVTLRHLCPSVVSAVAEIHAKRACGVLPFFEDRLTTQHPAGSALQTACRIKVNRTGLILLIESGGAGVQQF